MIVSNFTFTPDQPIYHQLATHIKIVIASGRLSPNDPLPSVRELSNLLNVNPMTVSRAYSILISDGVVSPHRGQNMTVNEVDCIELKSQLLKHSIDRLAYLSKQFNISSEELSNLFLEFAQ